MHAVEKSKGLVFLNSQYVVAPYNPLFDLDWTDDFTISFWTYSTSAVSGVMFMHDSGSTQTGAGWDIASDSSARFYLRMRDTSGGVASFRVPARTTNIWTHTVFTKTGGDPNNVNNWRAWVNGLQTALTTSSTTFNTGSSMLNNDGLQIGGYAGAYVPGRYRDLQIYRRVLNQYEVRRLYNAGRNVRPLLYSKGLTPDCHYIYDPTMYIQPGGENTTIFLRDEKTKLYNLSGTLVTGSRIEKENVPPSTVYGKSGWSMAYKSLTQYDDGNFYDTYHTLYKNAGDGATYSRAASIKKIIGNGKVKFRNMVFGTTARVVHMGIHNQNSIPSTPTSFKFVAGFGNTGVSQGRVMYVSGSTMAISSTAANGETCEIDVNFDSDKITISYYTGVNAFVLSTTASLSASTLFPTQEWYFTPITLYINNDFVNSNYRQAYYVSLDMNVSNPGIVTNNDLV